MTYLSGKMSVISFSNQFSRCFSHNSGDFLLDARTENPFIPCLYLWPLYQGLVVPNYDGIVTSKKGWIPLYHACLSTARPLPTLSCPSFSVDGTTRLLELEQKRGIHSEQTSASCLIHQTSLVSSNPPCLCLKSLII